MPLLSACIVGVQAWLLRGYTLSGAANDSSDVVCWPSWLPLCHWTPRPPPGFTYPVLPKPIGLSRDVDIVPASRPLLLFDSNTAHSSGYMWCVCACGGERRAPSLLAMAGCLYGRVRVKCCRTGSGDVSCVYWHTPVHRDAALPCCCCMPTVYTSLPAACCLQGDGGLPVLWRYGLRDSGPGQACDVQQRAPRVPHHVSWAGSLAEWVSSQSLSGAEVALRLHG